MYNKQLFYRGLDQLPIYIEDTLTNSPYYFNIVEIPKVFGPGKNSIRFNLNNNNLDIYKNIDVEIIDSYGNVVYHETPEYFQSDEANIGILTVYLYNRVVNGPLKITFVGCAKIDLKGNPIPESIRNTFNVRYSTIVEFNRFQKNTSRLLFSVNPSISIQETRTPYVSRSLSTSPTLYMSGTGNYKYNQSYPVLEIPLGTVFINDMLNAQVALTGSNFLPDFSGYSTSSYSQFSTSIINFLDSQTAILDLPWTASIYNMNSSPVSALVKSADVISYTLAYTPTPDSLSTENYKSFVNLQIKNMDPVSGYLSRIKLYGKSKGSLDQYELLGESLTNNTELLINSASLYQYDRSNVGYFLSASLWPSFWTYNNSFLDATFTSSSLFNSIYLSPTVNTSLNNVLFTSNIDVNFQKGSPYRLFFNYKQQEPFILEVYMSGSAFKNTSANLGERVFYLDSSIYGANYRNLPIDFLSTATGTARLQFKILTGSLYISDISLKSGAEQGFNASNFNAYFPITVKSRNDVFDFRVDLIDDNGQISSYEYSNSNIQISGSNQYIEGNDNLLPGQLNLGKTTSAGIVLDGNSNKISTYGYTGGQGFAFWSGSQIISGSSQPGTGFFIETGAPFYHSIKASGGGKIEIIANISGSSPAGGVTETTFNAYTSSVSVFANSINSYTSSINSATGSFATTGSNNFTGDQVISGSVTSNVAYVSKVPSVTLVKSTTTTAYIYDGERHVGGSFDVHIQKSSTQFCIYHVLVSNDTAMTNTACTSVSSASYGEEVAQKVIFSSDISGDYVRLRIQNTDNLSDFDCRVYPRLIYNI
jgi:hypothetical protein